MTEPSRQERLASRGITETSNGRLRLPPVLIMYADGTNQNIFLEVEAQSHSAPEPARPPTVLADFLFGRSRGFSSVVPREIPLVPVSPHGRPLLGLREPSYPALDVSRERLARDDGARSDLFSEVMGPFRRAMEGVDGSEEAQDEGSGSATSLHQTETSRNIILTVNYIYGQMANQQPHGAAGRDAQDGITGSLVLHVPGINESSEDNLQVLIRLATIIALRTISTSIKKASGVPDTVFDKFKVRTVDSIDEADRQCAICYEKYEEESKKRKRQRSKPAERKRQRTEMGKSEKEKGEEKVETDTTESDDDAHYPVEMPCGHIFGRSCLHEWLKTNNSCPLCRDKIKHTRGSESAYATTVILPNLARVVSDSREAIDGFNSRQFTFRTPDYDGGVTEIHEDMPSAQESLLPIPPPFRYPTIVTLNPLQRQALRPDAAGGAGAAPHTAAARTGVLGLVNNLIQAFHGRFPRQGGSGDRLDHVPIVRTVRTVHESARRGNSAPHRRRRTGAASSTATGSASAAQSNAFFPIGVASRRTEAGVVTTPITEDVPEQHGDTTDTQSAASRTRSHRPGPQ